MGLWVLCTVLGGGCRSSWGRVAYSGLLEPLLLTHVSVSRPSGCNYTCFSFARQGKCMLLLARGRTSSLCHRGTGKAPMNDALGLG